MSNLDAAIRAQLAGRGHEPAFLAHAAILALLDLARASEGFGPGHDGMAMVWSWQIDQTIATALGVEVPAEPTGSA